MGRSYFTKLADHNAAANRRLYKACAGLSAPESLREHACFFGSSHATLDHVPVANRIWIAPIEGHTPLSLKLDQILYAELIGPRVARLLKTRISALRSAAFRTLRPTSRLSTAI
jgi:uncharacterized damage-inducible protein DinB